MPGKFHHESMYRGADAGPKIAAARLTLCGAGAIGSNLADHLARQGFARLKLIDRDRVEEHNISTQLYDESEVGLWKVESLRNRLFRATGVEIEAVRRELVDSNIRPQLRDADLIIDAFDNSVGRKLVQDAARANRIPCLHVGLFEGYAEVIWDETYRIPHEAGSDVCDYPLARNLALLATIVASETIMQFILTGVRQAWSATLNDLAVRPIEPPR